MPPPARGYLPKGGGGRRNTYTSGKNKISHEKGKCNIIDDMHAAVVYA